jgi:hypothetical protein
MKKVDKSEAANLRQNEEEQLKKQSKVSSLFHL